MFILWHFEALMHSLSENLIKEGEETAGKAVATSTMRGGNESRSGISIGSRPLTWAWLHNVEEGLQKYHQAQSRGGAMLIKKEFRA